MLRVFLGALAMLDAVLLYRHIPDAALPSDSSTLGVAVALSAMLALSYRFQLQFGFKTLVALDTSVIFAAVLLFEPGTATLIVLVGVLIGQVSRRFDFIEYLFNVAQVLLQVGLAAIVLEASGWSYGQVRFEGASAIVALVAVPIIIFGLNALSVAIVISIQTGLHASQVLLRSTIRNDGIELVGQFVVGLFGALIATDYPWAIVLFAIPAIIIRTSLKRQHELRMRSITAVEGLADLVDLRDPYTADHSRRVADVARAVATEMGLDFDQVELIARAGRVHDVGKVFIDFELLTKPGRLSAPEWAIFEQHPVDGVKILELFPGFEEGRELVLHHHERIDGDGYPSGLRGHEIPLGARILAVADGFDAMASSRPYRAALATEVVIAELRRGRGTQWDATAIDTLLYLVDRRRIIFGNTLGPPRIVNGFDGPEPLPSGS